MSLAERRWLRVCTPLSSLVLPISPLARIVTVLTALVLLSLVHSERLLSQGILPEVSNATCSGVAKSAKVIAVKVFDDTGCVYYLFPRSLPVRILLSIDPVAGPTCALLFHKRIVFWTSTSQTAFPELTGLLKLLKTAVALLLLP